VSATANRSESGAEGRFTVRPALQSDALAIARIYNHHVDTGGATFDNAHWTDARVRTLVSATAPESWLVAETGVGGIIGWASARWYSLRHGYRFTLETAIYLDPSSMGRGVADSLQRQLEHQCREQGIHHLVAKITADNRRSIAFHGRHGYELVGFQKEVGHMEGEWKDVAILQKLLERTS
jgi:phosphinothricin acetyltransferase